MRLRYTPAAVEDLRQLRAYLIDEFGADAAEKALAKIVGNISNLKASPNLMGDLSDKIHRPSKYKYYLCSKLSTAILSCDTAVTPVIRILDMRSDYVAMIFGSNIERKSQ